MTTCVLFVDDVALGIVKQGVKEVVVDAFGVEAKIGQTVAFAQPCRGAKEFQLGEIVKVHNKSVTIEVARIRKFQDGRTWVEKDYPLRSSRCFVIEQ